MQVKIITEAPYYVQTQVNYALDQIKEDGGIVIKIDTITVKEKLSYSIYYASPDEIRESKLSTILDK